MPTDTKRGALIKKGSPFVDDHLQRGSRYILEAARASIRHYEAYGLCEVDAPIVVSLHPGGQLANNTLDVLNPVFHLFTLSVLVSHTVVIPFSCVIEDMERCA